MWERSEFNDWPAWDWRIDRPQLIQLYISRNIQPAEPFQEYLDAFKYKAEVDSCGLAEFLALPEAEQQERRLLAHAYREKALRFRRLINELWEDNLSNRAIADYWAWPNPSGAGDGITRAMSSLVKASGIDPANPYTWYDLAYFTGIIGDEVRCRSYMDASLAAMDAFRGSPPGGFAEMRVRIALDYAWMLRDQGRHIESLSWLDRADSLFSARPPRTPDIVREARLIRGLVWADMGWLTEARTAASKLRGIKVWVRNWIVFDDQYAMTSVGAPADKRAWETQPMDFATNWIWALTYLKQGDQERALDVIGDLKIYTLKEYPPSYNYRFWNDLGWIYEQCGLMGNARLCYGMAAVFRPYFVYYPMIGARGSARVHGQAGSGTPYFLSYRHFFIGGSLFSYAANCALAFEVEKEPVRKSMLADVALAKLNACRRRGIRGASALALRGRVHYFLNNLNQAEEDLLLAYKELKELGREDPDVTLLIGILTFDRRDFTGSLPWFKRFVQLQPEKGIGWRALGLAHIFANQPEEALVALNRALELEPESAVGWYNRGLVNLRAQHWPEAEADLEQALALWPGNKQVAKMLAIAEEGPIQQITLVPSRFELHVSRRDSLRIARLKTTASLNLADEITTADPDLASRWLHLSQAGIHALLPDLEAAYHADPSRENMRQLAWCYLRANRPGEVQRLLLPSWDEGIAVEELCLLLEADRSLGATSRAQALAASLAYDPEPVADVNVWALVASICLDQGLYQLADKALQTAIQMDPDNTTLRAQQARVQELQNCH
jgi:tetratricopeptide (TPR) repeat protein